MQFWKSTNLQKCQEVLNQLLVYTSQTGLSLNFNTMPLLQELEYSCLKEINASIIINILKELKSKRKSTIQDFELSYQKKYLIKEEDACKIILPYENYIPSNQFRISGLKFRIVSNTVLKKNINYEKVIAAIKGHHNIEIREIKFPQYLLFIESLGNNIFSAWENIKDTFSILQGIHDFALTKNTLSIGNFYYPQTQFNHPKWMILEKIDKKVEVGNFETFIPHKSSPISLIRSGTIKKFLSYAKSAADEGSTKTLIYGSFRLYAQALESIHKNNSFLSLWQLIENVCNSERIGGKPEKIIVRLNIITKDMLAENLLNLNSTYSVFSLKRNEIVHKGIDRTTMVDVNILKLLAETCIEWLIKHETRLKTKLHIEEYFLHKTKNLKERKVILETIKFLSTK